MRTVQRICVAGPLSAVLAVLGLLAGPAASALAGSESFTSPGEHPFVVPAGVTSVQVLLVGGNGGTGSDGQVGGIPATASATIAVTPGETLYAEVAGDGESAGDGAFGSGGAGGGGAGGVLEGFSPATAPVAAAAAPRTSARALSMPARASRSHLD